MSWWELAKRHKGKIIAGGAIIGGAVALSMGMKNEERAEERQMEESGLQARRHYVFDANQSACDESIRELAPSIIRSVHAHFPVETVTRQLQEREMSSEKKIECWNELKIMVIGRLVCTAHALSLLTLTLKAQISMLAADIVVGMGGGGRRQGWFAWASSMIAVGGGKGGEQSVEERRRSDGSRQVFLRAIEFFTQTGVGELAAAVEETVRREMKVIRLDSSRDSDELLALLTAVSARVTADAAPLSSYIAPIEKEDTSRDPVSLLLRRLVSLLEGPECRETAGKLAEFYISTSVRSVKTGALATQLSSLSAACSNLLQGRGGGGGAYAAAAAIDSPLEQSLCSADVHRFAIHAFNAPTRAA